MEELFRAHWPLVYGYLLRRTRDPHRAEDLAADTFEKALRAAPSFRGGSAAGWLLAIARNVLVDASRRKRFVLVPVDAADEHGQMGPEASTDFSLVFAELQERDRRLLSLLHVYGFTVEEVSAIVGASPAAVRTAAYRARAAARRLLEER